MENSQTNESQAVIQLFDPYIKGFQSHQYCSRKYLDEKSNEERDDYVIVSLPEKNKPLLECYSEAPPRGKKEFFCLFEGDRICSSIKHQEKTKLFPIPRKDKHGEDVSYENEKGNIIKLYLNEYQEKKCYIVDSKSENVDHSTCKKEKCMNEGIDQNYIEYDKGQPCAMINEAKTLGNKCCWIIENAELYTLRLTDLFFFAAMKMIDGIDHDDKNVIQIDLFQIKQSGIFDQIAEQKSFNFFLRECLKQELLNKKNIGFGSLIGCLFYRYSSSRVKSDMLSLVD